MQEIRLRLGDSFELLRVMDDDSVGAVCTDPPYGLEFMGKDWDRLWETGAGMSKVGLGDRSIPWPSHGGSLPHGGMNPTCSVCGGRLRGAKKCNCEQPHDHWKPIGKRRDKKRVATGGATFTTGGSERFSESALPSFTGDQNPICENCGGSQRGNDRKGFKRCRCDNPSFPNTRLQQTRAMQEWHRQWLAEVFRILKPGGIIKVFGATRTFHRMAAAMEQVGFVDLDLEAWMYGSGFPKSLNVSKALDKKLGGEREVVGENPTHRKVEGDGSIYEHSDTQRPVSGEFITAAATPEARRFEGYGTALKPAWEPFVIGRKPECPATRLP